MTEYEKEVNDEQFLIPSVIRVNEFNRIMSRFLKNIKSQDIRDSFLDDLSKLDTTTLIILSREG